jgi:hypothetical protein
MALQESLRERDEEGHTRERHAANQICHPLYTPDGELRVKDLDGYTV